MRLNQLGTRFFPDSHALYVLYALNVGRHRCLRAGSDECGLVGSEREFEAPIFAVIVGSKVTLFASPSDPVCGLLQLTLECRLYLY